MASLGAVTTVVQGERPGRYDETGRGDLLDDTAEALAARLAWRAEAGS